MNKTQKIRSLFAGILMILGGFTLLIFGEDSIPIIIFIYATIILISAIQSFFYYFTMAKYMVGGKKILGKAIILLDLAIFTSVVIRVPTGFIILYLIGIHLFESVIDIFNALEAKRLGASVWRLRLFSGIYNSVLFVFGIFSFRRPVITVTIYAIGIITSGIVKIVNCFRRTATVYIS